MLERLTVQLHCNVLDFFKEALVQLQIARVRAGCLALLGEGK
jgi:hypothetical protein